MSSSERAKQKDDGIGEAQCAEIKMQDSVGYKGAVNANARIFIPTLQESLRRPPSIFVRNRGSAADKFVCPQSLSLLRK
jgi:hypothetical protein